jgi:hypothetical protein
MEINKSTRHSKITGDFSESLVLYWLSKYGFECAFVDHTGIDIIAYNPHNKERMGISVKSRSRNTGKEGQYLSIPNPNFEKARSACDAFGCIPYFAIVVDEGNDIHVFITSMSHLLELHPMKKKVSGWKMSKLWLERYYSDPKIKIFNFKHQTKSWW